MRWLEEEEGEGFCSSWGTRSRHGRRHGWSGQLAGTGWLAEAGSDWEGRRLGGSVRLALPDSVVWAGGRVLAVEVVVRVLSAEMACWVWFERRGKEKAVRAWVLGCRPG